MKNRLIIIFFFLCSLLPLGATNHWVGTWGTAPQLVETYNNPPSPGLQNNSLRQIVQVSIGGETVRLKLTNEFSNSETEIKSVEIARALSAGSSADIDEESAVSLTFNGSTSVNMSAGETATSDAVNFHLDPRMNVAITIHYGKASANVSGHPGSRTTSYLKSGNTSDFSNATKTDHWYNILTLEVMAPEKSGTVAILGNSITDGRGSTTNQQDRWTDILSRRLLLDAATSETGVLNMGIGGNCVLSGGLGPTAKSRYRRDLLEQEGVKWIILFEAINDLGNSQNGEQTANSIIDVYKEIIREAHHKGIRVFGATITPFKNSSYYNTSRERGRKVINDWIKKTKMLDGVIDFAAAVCDPQDSEALQAQYLYQNDWLHLNARGYEAMGNAIDLSLFTQTGPLASDSDEEGEEHHDGLTSNLPLIIINTTAAINANEKVPGTMKVVNNGEGVLNNINDPATDYDGHIGIKLRGNSSLSFDQKKYTIETWDEQGNDLKVSLLGMPEESDWVLLAPYNDISLLRDVFAFNMWTEMGHWAPRTCMCEVVVNNEYMGVYVFCEKIKRDKARVDISKLKEDDLDGRELTGGYIVRVDAYDENDATFTSKVKGLPNNNGGGWPWGGGGNSTVTWTVYHPKKEKLQPVQKNYIQQFVDGMELSFQNQNFADPIEGYAKWIDVPSFVDYFIHTELSLNADGFKRSSYFYKDKDSDDGTISKMVAGPTWDYNLAYGCCNFCNANNVRAWVYEGCNTNPTPAFWKKLTTDPNFMDAVKIRYAQLRQSIISQESINIFFDDYAQLLDEAKDRHYAKYSNLLVDSDSQGGSWWWGGGNNSPVAYFAAYFVSSYEEEIQTVKEWFQKRLAFLDAQWDYQGTLAKVNDINMNFFDVKVYQRNKMITLKANREVNRVEIYTLNGCKLRRMDYPSGNTTIQFSLKEKGPSPVILVCYASDGSYITRKLQQLP